MENPSINQINITHPNVVPYWNTPMYSPAESLSTPKNDQNSFSTNPLANVPRMTDKEIREAADCEYAIKLAQQQYAEYITDQNTIRKYGK